MRLCFEVKTLPMVIVITCAIGLTGCSKTPEEVLALFLAQRYEEAIKATGKLKERNQNVEYECGRTLLLGLGGVTRDVEKGVEHLSWAAQNGSVPASQLLVEVYSGGHGSRVDISQLNRWHENLARLGDVSALMHLGTNYLQGTSGLKHDESKGIELLRRAWAEAVVKGNSDRNICVLAQIVNLLQEYGMDRESMTKSEELYEICQNDSDAKIRIAIAIADRSMFSATDDSCSINRAKKYYSAAYDQLSRIKDDKDVAERKEYVQLRYVLACAMEKEYSIWGEKLGETIQTFGERRYEQLWRIKGDKWRNDVLAKHHKDGSFSMKIGVLCEGRPVVFSSDIKFAKTIHGNSYFTPISKQCYKIELEFGRDDEECFTLEQFKEICNGILKKYEFDNTAMGKISEDNNFGHTYYSCEIAGVATHMYVKSGMNGKLFFTIVSRVINENFEQEVKKLDEIAKQKLVANLSPCPVNDLPNKKIVGAFGVEFGKPFPIDKIDGKLSSDGRYYTFKLVNDDALIKGTFVNAFITPVTKVVYRIIASFPYVADDAIHDNFGVAENVGRRFDHIIPDFMKNVLTPGTSMRNGKYGKLWGKGDDACTITHWQTDGCDNRRGYDIRYIKYYVTFTNLKYDKLAKPRSSDK